MRADTDAGTDEAERFRALFEDAYDDVLRFVRRRCGEASAEDITADVFMTAWRRFGDLPTTHDERRAWLFGTARNTVSTTLRSTHRQDALRVRLARAPAPVDTTTGEHDAAELRVDVARAWEHLSTTAQEALSLAVLENLRPREASTVLGISPVAYRIRLSRARRDLLEHLGRGSPAARSPWPSATDRTPQEIR